MVHQLYRILKSRYLSAEISMFPLCFLLQMYDFENDYINVYTGENDIRQTGLIEKFNGNVNLPQWTGKCANVKGASDGSKFANYIKPNDTILFFRKSLCRSALMVSCALSLACPLRIVYSNVFIISSYYSKLPVIPKHINIKSYYQKYSKN